MQSEARSGKMSVIDPWPLDTSVHTIGTYMHFNTHRFMHPCEHVHTPHTYPHTHKHSSPQSTPAKKYNTTISTPTLLASDKSERLLYAFTWSHRRYCAHTHECILFQLPFCCYDKLQDQKQPGAGRKGLSATSEEAKTINSDLDQFTTP